MRSKKSNTMHFNYLLILISLLNFPSFIHSKSIIEPCFSSDTCTSYLSYRLPYESKISEIAYKFQINVTDLLSANAMDWSKPSSYNQILPTKSTIKIPISCPCIDGIRRSFSTNYSIKVADSLDSIAESYGGLVSVEQIKSVNNISDENLIRRGGGGAGGIVIPLPCTCFNNSNYGSPAVYLSYVVKEGENLSSIADEYGVTVSNLENVNGLSYPVQIHPADILAIPLPGNINFNIVLFFFFTHWRRRHGSNPH